MNEFLIQLEVERNETGGNLDESFESEEDDNNKDTEDEKKDQIRDFFGPKFLAHGLKTGSLFQR